MFFKSRYPTVEESPLFTNALNPGALVIDKDLVRSQKNENTPGNQPAVGPSTRVLPVFGQGELFGPPVVGQRTYFHSNALEPGEVAVQLPYRYPRFTCNNSRPPASSVTSVYATGNPVLMRKGDNFNRTLTGNRRGTISKYMESIMRYVDLSNGTTVLARVHPARIVKTPMLKMRQVNQGSRQALDGRELPTDVLAMIGTYLGLPKGSIDKTFGGSTRRRRM